MFDTIKKDITKADWIHIFFAAIISIIVYIILIIVVGKIISALYVPLDYITGALQTAVFAVVIPVPLVALFAFWFGYRLSGKKICGALTLAVSIILIIILPLVWNFISSLLIGSFMD